jgi:hypothetical protein
VRQLRDKAAARLHAGVRAGDELGGARRLVRRRISQRQHGIAAVRVMCPALAVIVSQGEAAAHAQAIHHSLQREVIQQQRLVAVSRARRAASEACRHTQRPWH